MKRSKVSINRQMQSYLSESTIHTRGKCKYKLKLSEKQRVDAEKKVKQIGIEDRT